MADSGEDAICFCTACDYAANLEKAEIARPAVMETEGASLPAQEVHTPEVRTIEEVCGFLGVEPEAVVKTKLKKATSIVGFLNHLQGDLKLKAVEAGCDTVMPRSAFSQSLPNLLRRYGVEEEEEYAQQPTM